MKLLIADAEHSAREQVHIRLKKGGYEFEQVFYAGSGLEAYHIIKEMMPDIVITDVEMEYMTGLELLQRCRKEGILASFIVVSRYAEFEYIQAALEHEVCGYLLKPVVQEKLFGAMNRAVSRIKESRRLSGTLLENEQLHLTNLIMKCRQDIISEPEYSQLLQHLNIEREYEFLGAVVHVSTYRHDRFAGAEDVYQTIMQLLTARIPVLHRMLPYKKGTDGFFLLAGTQMRQKERMMHTVWQDVVQKLKNSGAVITVGLSEISARIDSGFLLSAEKALSQRFEKGIGDVYSGHMIRESADISQILDISDFTAQVHHKNGEETAAELEKLAAQLYPHIYNLEFLFQYLCDLMEHMGYLPDKKFWKHYIENRNWTYCKNLEEILESIRGEIRRTCQRPVRDETPVHERVKRYIEAHFGENVTLGGLAGQFHLNPRYLASVYKKEEGLSPTDYLTQVRIEQACKKLESSDVPASEIAAQVGYDDPRYFYKVFKKQTGVTPKEYRQNREISSGHDK